MLTTVNFFGLLIFGTNIYLYMNSASITPSIQDDYYCQAVPRVYNICRRCNSTTEDCETSQKCQCDNIQIAGTAKDFCKQNKYTYITYFLKTVVN